MRRLLLALLSLVFTHSAYAQSCAARLVNPFTAAEATKLCAAGLQIVDPVLNFETIAVAGTVQGDATAVSGTRFFHQVTGANGTAGIRLPAAATADVGKVHFFLNTTAGVLRIFPATGAQINGAGANTVFAALTGVKPVICYVTAANTWICS